MIFTATIQQNLESSTSGRVDGRIETHWLVNELGHRFIHVYFFCAKRPGIVFIDSQGYESVDDILYGILNVLSRQKLALTQAQCNVYAFALR